MGERANGERLTEEVMVRMAPSMKKRLHRAAKKAHRKPPAEIRLAIEKHLERAA